MQICQRQVCGTSVVEFGSVHCIAIDASLKSEHLAIVLQKLLDYVANCKWIKSLSRPSEIGLYKDLGRVHERRILSPSNVLNVPVHLDALNPGKCLVGITNVAEIYKDRAIDVEILESYMLK